MTRDISNSEDVIDSRDVIARIEELEAERAQLAEEAEDARTAHAAALTTESATAATEALQAVVSWDTENAEDLAELKALAEDGEGYSDWEHGATLIRDSYFRDYAEELAEDCGMIQPGAQWPYTCIDWERAARELRMDYTAIEFGGITYWVR